MKTIIVFQWSRCPFNNSKVKYTQYFLKKYACFNVILNFAAAFPVTCTSQSEYLIKFSLKFISLCKLLITEYVSFTSWHELSSCLNKQYYIFYEASKRKHHEVVFLKRYAKTYDFKRAYKSPSRLLQPVKKMNTFLLRVPWGCIK